MRDLKTLLAEARGRVHEITTAEAAEILDKEGDTLFLDVREPDEYLCGHVPGALLVPRGVLEMRAAPDSLALDPDLEDPSRPIVVYCTSGGRSALAAVTLAEFGFEDVRSMAGGMKAWVAEARPVGT
jgi:rhodanese-related sulfurtransferase